MFMLVNTHSLSIVRHSCGQLCERGKTIYSHFSHYSQLNNTFRSYSKNLWNDREMDFCESSGPRIPFWRQPIVVFERILFQYFMKNNFLREVFHIFGVQYSNGSFDLWMLCEYILIFIYNILLLFIIKFWNKKLFMSYNKAMTLWMRRKIMFLLLLLLVILRLHNHWLRNKIFYYIFVEFLSAVISPVDLNSHFIAERSYFLGAKLHLIIKDMNKFNSRKNSMHL